MLLADVRFLIKGQWQLNMQYRHKLIYIGIFRTCDAHLHITDINQIQSELLTKSCSLISRFLGGAATVVVSGDLIWIGCGCLAAGCSCNDRPFSSHTTTLSIAHHRKQPYRGIMWSDLAPQY